MLTLDGRTGSSSLRPLICGSCSCRAIVSCVCCETSPSSKVFSSAAEAVWGSDGTLPVRSESTCTPFSLPLVKAKAKFIRPRIADEFTQASASWSSPSVAAYHIAACPCSGAGVQEGLRRLHLPRWRAQRKQRIREEFLL